MFVYCLLDCIICVSKHVAFAFSLCRSCSLIAVNHFFCRSLPLVRTRTLILLPRWSSERLLRTLCIVRAGTRQRICTLTCGASGDFQSWKRLDCLRRRLKPSHTATVTALLYGTSNCDGFFLPMQIGVCLCVCVCVNFKSAYPEC